MNSWRSGAAVSFLEGQDMLMDKDFLQKVILLLLAAVVSGGGIPLVLKFVDERRLRQAKIVDAQAKLLDDLTRILWRWRYLAKRVTYYGANGDKERFESAKKQYEDTVWELLHDLRTEISRSRRLASEKAFHDLNILYDELFHKLDLEITALISKEMNQEKENWALLANRFTNEVSAMLDTALNSLAAELRLQV